MEKGKYDRITDILKRSRPILKDPGEIENNVMRLINQKGVKKTGISELPDRIFGWVFIGWLRRSLIVSSALLILVFVYQQGIILRKINSLEKQAVYSSSGLGLRNTGFYPENKIARIAGLKLIRNREQLSEKEIERLLDSYNELESRYKDILKVIDENPELKEYFKDELRGLNENKIKL